MTTIKIFVYQSYDHRSLLGVTFNPEVAADLSNKTNQYGETIGYITEAEVYEKEIVEVAKELPQFIKEIARIHKCYVCDKQYDGIGLICVHCTNQIGQHG